MTIQTIDKADLAAYFHPKLHKTFRETGVESNITELAKKSYLQDLKHSSFSLHGHRPSGVHVIINALPPSTDPIALG